MTEYWYPEISYQTTQIIVSVVGVAFAVLGAFYFLYIKRRMRVFILKAYRGGLRAIFQKRVPRKQELLTVGKHTYELDTKECIEDKRGTAMLFYTEGDLQPIQIKPNEKPRSSRMFTDILKSAVRRKLMGGGKETGLFVVIIVLVIALIGVAVFSFWQYNEMNNKIIELLKDGGGIVV